MKRYTPCKQLRVLRRPSIYVDGSTCPHQHSSLAPKGTLLTSLPPGCCFQHGIKVTVNFQAPSVSSLTNSSAEGLVYTPPIPLTSILSPSYTPNTSAFGPEAPRIVSVLPWGWSYLANAPCCSNGGYRQWCLPSLLSCSCNKTQVQASVFRTHQPWGRSLRREWCVLSLQCFKTRSLSMGRGEWAAALQVSQNATTVILQSLRHPTFSLFPGPLRLWLCWRLLASGRIFRVCPSSFSWLLGAKHKHAERAWSRNYLRSFWTCCHL